MWYSNLAKYLFLDISSANIDTLVPSLYQCVDTRSMLSLFTVVSAISTPPFQPLRHQRNIYHPVVNHFTRQTLLTINTKHFFMNILCCSLVVKSSNTVAILTTETSLWTCTYMSATWTVLLPSDTHRKPIMSITAVLLPFVTYLPTLPHTITLTKWMFIHSNNMAT
jgi:hypothetical protein